MRRERERERKEDGLLPRHVDAETCTGLGSGSPMTRLSLNEDDDADALNGQANEIGIRNDGRRVVKHGETTMTIHSKEKVEGGEERSR